MSAILGLYRPSGALLRARLARAGVSPACRLLDLRLFELDVLLGHRVVLLEHQLLGARARVRLRHVKEPRAGGRQQLDLLRYGFGHDRGTWFGKLEFVCALAGSRTIATAALVSSKPRAQDVTFVADLA